ncbi:hypothetical protein [Prosthecomicrobium hirschii]|uniref:hypothetical protein n=1 Tax=Prosthecodimorpha hirschii TaxID=665126 RepID=UPI00221FFFB1|nr:hypothetical protein [Prosthecomicrobium hirschii]MCW1843985.1 hypothetical protein [Prosthecomicrobium hirschii]
MSASPSWPALGRLVLLFAGLLLAAFGVASPSAAAGAKAEIAATLEKGFGRIVITFKDRSLLPQFTSRVNNGVLVIQFAEPVQMEVERLPTQLAPYVTIARRDPDGQAIRLGLTRQVRINTMEAGERLFVDLLPATWAGPPPTLPESVVLELAKRAETALKAQREAEKQRFGVKVLAKLDFRVGRNPTFTRFSFGWNVPFDTQMARDADKVTLTFNRLAEIDFAPVIADPPPTLREIRAEPDGEKLRVVMTIAPEADVRAFREEQTYVVDLSHPAKPGNPAEAAIRKVLDPEADKQRTVVNAPGTARPPEAGKTPEAGKAPVAGKAGMAPEAKPAGPSAAGPSVAGAARPPVAAAGADPAVKTSLIDLPPEPDPTPPPKPVAAVEKAAAAPSAEEEAGDDAGASGEARPEVRSGRSNTVKIVRVEAKRIGSVVRVAFPFPGKVASAAVKRGDNLWIVFDTQMSMDLRAIAAVLGTTAADVTVNRTERGQVLRIRLTEPMLTTLGLDGNSWILSIGEMVLEPARPLALKREFRSEGQGLIRVALPDAGSVHEINDASTGDMFYVVTAFGPPRGLLKPYSFPELETLASAHGVAVVPRTDDLKVGIEFDSVVMTRERGLTISTGALGSPSYELPKPVRKAARRVVDPSTFAVKDPAEFTERVRGLIDQIAEAGEQQKAPLRFQLAEFYVAHRFAPEALGILRLLAADEPGIERDPGFIVLFGAAQTMAGRTAPALRALSRTEVADNPDAALWRTIAAAAEQKWDEARDAAQKGAGAVGGYPIDIQAAYVLAGAEAAVELNDFRAAQSRLAEILPEEIAPDLRARYEMLQARIADAAGRPEDAMERLDRLAASTDRKAAAEAEYRRLRVLVRDQKIEAAEAIERLKSLVFGWRGDEIELKSLRFMAQLQAQHGLYREAFQNMRNALQVAPQSETAKLLQDDMGREFVSLYLDGNADRLKPVEALALYYDFRELTPVGRLGDEIVRRLADRLVGVDLLDQASELLAYQIDQRLRGAAKAQIAADLAMIHLIDRKPDKALAVLNKTRQSQLPVSVERQRRVVEARALSETGRADVALELLSALGGADVDRLRADIMWRAKRWHEAGERLETMLGGRWNEPTPLDDQERQDVIRAAVAYALASDDLALGRLRSKFADRMKDSPSAATFDVVTAPIQSQGTEFRNIAKEIAAIDTMRGFLDEYRSQYMKGPADAKPTESQPGKPPAAPGPAAANGADRKAPEKTASIPRPGAGNGPGTKLAQADSAPDAAKKR